MARQQYYTEPWRKHLEVYKDFSGGLNTVTSNDNLAESELTNLKNKNLGERGSLKRRHGMKRHITAPASGKGQGFFRYYKTNKTEDELLAVNGELFVKKSKLADPSSAPTLVKQVNTNSTLPAATYYVVYTWKNLSGETLRSPEANITTAAGEELKVTVPTFPLDVIEAGIYISKSTGTETLQTTITTTTYIQSSDLVAGSALPTTNTTDATKKLTITGLTSFQTTRPIEAVQFKGSLFIATGTKLVEYNGTETKVVTPYTPEPLEALYIGTNGLADNPDQYIADGTAANLRIDGVTTDKRYGVVNYKTTFTIYVSKPDTMSVEYRWYYREKGVEAWTLGRDWGVKTCEFTPLINTDYELDFYAREVGTTGNGVRYVLPSYKVKSTDENEVVDPSTIHNCNRILLHWDRLVLYGDTVQTEAIYVSHLNKPRYFPTPNSLLFENERKEGLTSLVRYRDILIAFTPTSIQALYGKAPIGDDPYRRVVLNTNIGCIAPKSTSVIGNVVSFLSREGVYILKSLGYTENRLNVEKIGEKVDNSIPRQEDACGTTLDGQYHLLFPQENTRFRYYEQWKVWTKDESPKLDFVSFYEWDGILYGQSSVNGNVLVFDESVYNDDGYVYTDLWETKYYDFGQPYNPKKLKEIQFLLSQQVSDVGLSVTIFADASKVTSPDTSHVSVDANGNIVWNTSSTPNITVNSGTSFGSWQIGEDSFGAVASVIKKLRLSGKCMRTRVLVEHTADKPNQVLGLAYIFKTKKP